MSHDARAVVQAQTSVESRVTTMLTSLADRDRGVLERLRVDVLSELQSWDDLTITPLDALPPSGCSIAGVYLAHENPPRIGYWAQSSRPRAKFTALHELGHHLQQTSPELVDELDAQADLGAYMEERTSDAFAARVLLPVELTRRVLGDGTPSVERVVNLWRESNVSRAAACVTAAQQLRSPGHILLLQGAEIQFSASVGEPPLRRGSDQSASSIVRARARSSLPIVTTDDTRFTYRDRISGTQLYAQATDMGGYTLVIAVAYGAPWRPVSLPSASPPIVGRWQTCGHCDNIFQVWGVRCELCGAGFCPECGKCDCESRVDERLCMDCFLMKPAHTFVEELCAQCAG